MMSAPRRGPRSFRRGLAALLLWCAAGPLAAAERVETPYGPQEAVFDFYLDHPAKMGAALYWVRAFMNPLTAAPYGYAPEELGIVVVIHGTEIATVARKNEGRYPDAVARMRYYASLGVEFKVCGLAAEDYGYRPEDLQGFVDVVPSAFNELAYWQRQGYALIVPRVYEKTFSIESIR